MKYLLDTDTCIYFLKGIPEVAARVASADADQVAIARMTQMELFFGAFHSARVEGNLKRVREFCQVMDILDVDDQAAEAFGRIKSALRRQGNAVADFDVAIAAIALTQGLTVVTNNARHFGRVEGLRFENWAV